MNSNATGVPLIFLLDVFRFRPKKIEQAICSAMLAFEFIPQTAADARAGDVWIACGALADNRQIDHPDFLAAADVQRGEGLVENESVCVFHGHTSLIFFWNRLSLS